MLLHLFSYYGLLYAGGVLLWLGVCVFLQLHPIVPHTQPQTRLESFYSAVYIALWIIVGGRLAYVCCYEPQWYWDHPEEIFALHQGGMSFHGAVVAAVLSAWYFGRRQHLTFRFLDSLALCAVIVLPLGRLCNFFNGEVFGRVTEVPWAVIFTNVDLQLRHPSQLYEALAEGPLCALILWRFMHSHFFRYEGQLAALFGFFYALCRFFIEFYREPDASVGFIWHYFTLGQLFCVLMAVASVGLAYVAFYSGQQRMQDLAQERRKELR